MGGLESDPRQESYRGEKMSHLSVITSRINEMSASLTTWNRIAIFLVAAAALVVVLYFVASSVARSKAAELDNARDELFRLENKQQALRIAEVETDSRARVAQVRAEIEERLASLSAEVARAKKEIIRSNEKAEVEQRERVRLEAEFAPRTIEQRESAKALLPFQSINVIIESLAESEPWRTAGQLAWLLSGAKWNVMPGMKRFIDTTAFGDGIIIETNGEDRAQEGDRSLAAAKALIEVLGRNKIQTDWRPSSEHLPPDTLRIRVGLKPIDYADHNRKDSAYGNVLYK